jgi:hypothetical protein
MDFIKAAHVILDFPRMQWCFRNQPNWAPLVSEKEVSLTASIVRLEPLRDDDGTELEEIQKEQLVRLLDSRKEVFEKSDEPTPYAEHRITLIDDRPIATIPYRMSPQRRAVLEEKIQKSKTDASSYSLGARLLQGEGPDKRPVEYASQLVTPAKKNHTTREKKGPVAYVVAAVDDLKRPLGKYHVSALRSFVPSVGESHSESVALLRRRGRRRKRSPTTAPQTKQPRTNDALLHVISEEFVEAVEVLLDHEKTIHKPGVPSYIPPEGS